MLTTGCPRRIGVLLGGPSAERAVSLESGRCVAEALESRGCEVTLIDTGDPAVDGTPGGSVAAARQVLAARDWSGVDVVFNALHGTFGEDGQLQALLDGLGVPYTGSSAAASHCAMQKSLAKRRFDASGVPTPCGLTIDAGWPAGRIAAAAGAIGWPLVVKPDAQGSSLGVSIVRHPAGLDDALRRAAEYGRQVLIEEYIAGTEWTVPVWDDQVLPLIEIAPASGFYDYGAKYLDDQTAYRLDFNLPPEVVQTIAQAGLAAARSVGADGLARVDLRLDQAGRPWVLEVNTSPGMTSHSLVPKSAARAGYSLGDLCAEECRRALARWRRPIIASA